LPFWAVRRTVYLVMGALEAILIAGANGSGKTTFARQVLPLTHPTVQFLNADEIRHEDPRFASDVAATRELLRRLQVA
jgi:predicted ABC-type ATPase